ncbi:hypothetical protein GWI33_000742 [Rhynchophorus ferrugineus]|uniref:Uncharacterized protein n=1 Tax=Rhynchophorus ferrugineus TaxID=354439 RepID=A0A834HMG1_RHYFE|nr:hypothetical protein GWI33_000742 [Rhynchophorus ferrugineus]
MNPKLVIFPRIRREFLFSFPHEINDTPTQVLVAKEKEDNPNPTNHKPSSSFRAGPFGAGSEAGPFQYLASRHDARVAPRPDATDDDDLSTRRAGKEFRKFRQYLTRNRCRRFNVSFGYDSKTCG